ncbi:MAG TPA: NAD-dependent epimerase/dehydratase family protein [Terriglobales bacterium]|nr:NAD-dependent epimerase/dehydratase family protein [Terriglobales bacterium]
MGVAVITGSAGLVGSEAVRFFAAQGLDVVGIDNDMRKHFFGHDASTEWQKQELLASVPRYRHYSFDIRDRESIFQLFQKLGRDIVLVVHAAAQPSHDWAAREPITDFEVNAGGTLHMLEATRQFCPEAAFIFASTNKVYGDSPNRLPLMEQESRWEMDPGHRYARGIDEEMSIDQCLHSVFGASKVAADVMVQEYGRYFGLKAACFRAGCLTGPNHSGTQLHGFLAYLMKCCLSGTPYRVFGYKGKQVRDNLHSSDLIRAFAMFFAKPRAGEVYNMGGGRDSNCSLREAIELCQEISGNALEWDYVPEPRTGDHIWWISDISKFQNHYPGYQLRYDVPAILREIHQQNRKRWGSPARAAHA